MISLVYVFAQSYTKLYIQFLDRVNNDKTINYNWENRFVLQYYGVVRKFYRIVFASTS